MKHIDIKNMQGKIKINKQSLADLIELIRISPISARILLVLSAYIDKKNRIVTTVKTLSHILNLKKEEIEYGLRKLAKEGFIDLEVVKLDHKQTAELVTHDENLYYESECTVWEVISRQRASNLDFNGRYIRATVNSNVITGTKDQDNRAFINIKNNLFFDKSLNENEIIADGWL